MIDPVVVSAREPSSWLRWMPNAAALARSSRALHEWLGMLWYQLRGR